MITVEVALGARSYPVLVGRGARHRLADVLPVDARRAAIVTQAGIGVDVDPGRDHEVFLIDQGEEAKTLASVESLCRRFAQWGLSRADVVVGVGGGVVTDVAGLAASVYHRGVPVVHVATTLLGQVDAAIGGKTGVNLPEGKNLVGTFWQPAAVLCDTEVLESLRPEEYRSGLGEVAKYHFLGGDGLSGGDLADMDLDAKVARCVAIKAAVVSADEREGGHRAVLNYGHTLAHALETLGGYGLRHGEAVGIGLVYAARLARHLGRIDDARVAEHERVVAGYGLATVAPLRLDPAEVVSVMQRDKKATSGLTFVLDGPRGVEPVAVSTLDAERILPEVMP
ncbi:MAG TPA: 3-dehydroquinate synthase family protein [Acidimicrobiales bacterium]|nr:3-dehydroquinate synthase family protein [Acidimicrobiales bacterium]